MPRKPDVLCAGTCGRMLRRGGNSAAEQMCRQCRSSGAMRRLTRTGPPIGSVIACAWCQEEFVKDHSRRVTCSAACSQSHRHRHVDRPCFWCGRPVEQEKHAKFRPSCAMGVCRSAIGRWDAGQVASSWTQRPHARSLRRERAENHLRRYEAGEAATSKVVYVSGRCSSCGTAFTALWTSGDTRHLPRYCSAPCAAFSGKARRRAGLDGDAVSWRYLVKRDGSACWLCGMDVRPDDHYWYRGTFYGGNWYPSVDHLIPVTHHGDNGEENCALAHRWCNSMRSDDTNRTSTPPPPYLAEESGQLTLIA